MKGFVSAVSAALFVLAAAAQEHCYNGKAISEREFDKIYSVFSKFYGVDGNGNIFNTSRRNLPEPEIGEAFILTLPCRTKDGFYEFVGNADSQNIGFGEVPVILGVFFTAHAFRSLGTLVIPSGFLYDFFSGIQQIALPCIFISQRFFHKADGVHVFDLRSGAERSAGQVYRNIDVAPHRAFLHFARTLRYGAL